jgi:hypothetical protein
MQVDPDDLALLDFREAELRKSFASVYIILQEVSFVAGI